MHAGLASSWGIKYFKINWKDFQWTVLFEIEFEIICRFTWIRISYRGNFWKFFADVFVKSDGYLACCFHWDSFLYKVDYFVNEKFKSSLNQKSQEIHEMNNSLNSPYIFQNITSFLIINPKPCKIGTCASLFPKSLLRVVT